jgi:hypothetical protein
MQDWHATGNVAEPTWVDADALRHERWLHRKREVSFLGRE